jgi:hypothetical protein
MSFVRSLFGSFGVFLCVVLWFAFKSAAAVIAGCSILAATTVAGLICIGLYETHQEAVRKQADAEAVAIYNTRDAIKRVTPIEELILKGKGIGRPGAKIESGSHAKSEFPFTGQLRRRVAFDDLVKLQGRAHFLRSRMKEEGVSEVARGRALTEYMQLRQEIWDLEDQFNVTRTHLPAY